MVREMLVALLQREAGFSVDAEAASGREALALVAARELEVLVLDIGLPDMDGAEVARRAKRAAPALKIVVLSVHDSRFIVQQMLRAGVEGYVVKSAALGELVQAIRAVADGKVYLSHDITRVATQALTDFDGRAALGAREREVLARLAEGKRSTAIASELAISVGTVEAHRRNIMRKLGLHTIAELTKYAIRRGLTSL